MSHAVSPSEIGLDAERLERAYTFLQATVDRGDLPSAVLLVARHDTALPPRAFGRMGLTPDSPPAQPDTLFSIASITKPVVVSALLLLVERGEIRLDDPAWRYVPEFGNRGKQAVTLRHLMTHTSGLPDMLPNNTALRQAHAPFTEFISHICQLPLDFAPGSHIQYQSMGIALLAEIAQRVTGMAMRDFLRREIFDPLGIADTALGITGLDPSRVAQIDVGPEMADADWNANRPYWQNFGAPWGGLFTTAGDFWRYARMLRNQGRVGNRQLFAPATIQAMLRDQTSAQPAIPAQVRAGNAWGLGWRLFPAVQWGYYGDLLSPGSAGHGGATGTVVWMDPVRDLTCILFTTQPRAESLGILGRCSNLVAASAVEV